MKHKYYLLWFDAWGPGEWRYYTAKRYCNTPREVLETYRWEKSRGGLGFTVERVEHE